MIVPNIWKNKKCSQPQPGVYHDMFHKHSGYPQKYEAHHSGIGVEFLGSEAVGGVDFEDGRTLPTAKTPIEIRRPRPSPRQGRRLGPPQVWNLSFLATGIPRPHPWLFMGVQACRLPALKRSKPLKPLKGHFNGFLWASSAGKSYPKARSIAVSGRSSVPFARHSQPTGIPRPHPWLFLGVQACRLPALKRSKRLSQIAGCVPKD